MRQLLIDIEVFPNYFLLGCMDFRTKEKFCFEIFNDIDQRKELYQFLNDYKEFWISFNGIGYDNPVLAYGQINKWWPHKSSEEVLGYLKKFSDDIITTRNGKKTKLYKEIDNLFSGISDITTFSKERNWEREEAEDIDLESKWYNRFNKYISYFQFVDIDLYLYWARMLRISKRISLKSLGIQLGYPVVQELPYDPSTILTDAQRLEVKNYNLEHDLGILYLLTKEKEADIIQRNDAQTRYGFPCYSWDGVKLGLNILLKAYCDSTNKQLEDIIRLRSPMESLALKDIILDKVSFKETDIDYRFNKTEVICNSFYSLLQHMKNRVVTTTTELSYSVIMDGVKYDIKSGGLHSKHQNDIIIPGNLEYRDVDVSSYYPTAGAVYKYVPTHLPGLELNLGLFKSERIEDKKAGRMADANLKKLALNGGYYGNLNNEYSPLYDPKQLLSVTINGQLFLLMLCEKFIEAGIKIDMVNTDGVTVLFEKSLEPKYKEICKWWEELTQMELEEAVYTKVVRANINNYIAVYDSGKVKRKGMFKFENLKEIPLGDSVDFLIIPKLLNEYFINGVKPEEAIKLGKWHIYDFCCSMKVDKTYSVEWNLKPQQRLNRFYVANKGAYLYKCRKGKKFHMLKGWGVNLYNNHKELPISEYNINYTYYLTQTNKLITELERKNQLELFS